MWIGKRENETLKYKCSSRWTSDRKSAAMENRPSNDPGVVMYNKCLDWAKDFKKMRNTKDICRLSATISVLNWVSSRYWLDQMRMIRVGVNRSSVVEAPYFTLDE